jgi:cytochrome c oxidase cbb3-type subunit 4
MEINELRGAITVVTLVTFLCICWWAYRSGNRERFKQDSLIPFLDERRPSDRVDPNETKAEQ